MMRPEKENDKSYFKLLLEESFNGNLFEKITDFFPGIIYVYDAEHEQIGYVNGQLKEVLGYSHEDVKSWDGDMMRLVFKDDVDAVREEIKKYNELDGESSYSFGCRFNRKEGDYFHFRIKGTVLRRKPDGKPGSILFVAQDVTREITSANEARASMELIKDSEDLLKYGTWKLDVDSRKMLWSEGMYRLFGYNPIPTDDSPDLLFLLKHVETSALSEVRSMFEDSLTEGREFEHSFDIVTETHEIKSISTKTRVVRDKDGKAVSVLGICWDISRYYALYRDLLHYKNMVTEKELFLKNGSWEYNAATSEMEWSEGMFHLFGYENPQELSNRKVDRAFMNSHQRAEEAIESNLAWDKALKEQDNFIREELIVNRAGDSKLLETYGKVIRDKNGQVLKVLGTTRDITDLRESELKLEHKIAELARSNKDLEEFAYVASHDLQEPLRKISTFSERLDSKFAQLLGNDGKVYLQRMKMASDNMRTLIDNLLEFSRTTTTESLFVPTDLNEILNEAAKELELKMEETQTAVEAQRLPVIEAIPLQIRQLFSNLLSNAIKFARPDVPPVIKISSRMLGNDEKKQLELNELTGYWEITVSDNGIGFEKEYEEKIFKIFQRLHGKSEYPGSGIGLAICKKIIDHHKGIIYAESERGKGSSFIFILPNRQYN